MTGKKCFKHLVKAKMLPTKNVFHPRNLKTWLRACLWHCYQKGTSAPLPPFERAGVMPPSFSRSPVSLNICTSKSKQKSPGMTVKLCEKVMHVMKSESEFYFCFVDDFW